MHDRVRIQATMIQPNAPYPARNDSPSYDDAGGNIKMLRRTQDVHLGGVPFLVQNKSQKLYCGGHCLGTKGNHVVRVTSCILCRVSGLGRWSVVEQRSQNCPHRKQCNCHCPHKTLLLDQEPQVGSRYRTQLAHPSCTLSYKF